MRKVLLPASWETEKLFFEGDDYFQSVLSDMDYAQKSVTMEMYIFEQDEIGEIFIDKFIALTRRGIKVQLIIDGIGSYHFFDRFYGELLANGIEVKMYNPLPFYHPAFEELTIFQKIKMLWIRLLHINKRNHRKIIIIDEKILYTGSFNITSDHSNHYKQDAWLDTGVRVTGEAVKFAVMSFKRIWKLKDYRKYRKSLKKQYKLNWKRMPLRLNTSIRMRLFLTRDLKNRIKKANQRIWITTPYFIPTRSFIRELAKAARRGVDVKLLISARTDIKFFNFLQYFYYPYLLKNNVKVYRYTPRILHAKHYIIDEWMILGTTNLNHRSMIHDLEVDTIISEHDNRLAMSKHFIDECAQGVELTKEELKKESIFTRFFAGLFFIFRYWM